MTVEMKIHNCVAGNRTDVLASRHGQVIEVECKLYKPRTSAAPKKLNKVPLVSVNENSAFVCNLTDKKTGCIHNCGIHGY